MPPTTRSLSVACVIASLLLAGCGADAPEAAAPDPCAGAVNLIENPGFTALGEDSLLEWQVNQHAGEQSFELDMRDGEVTIRRIATQPWFTLVQFPDMESVRGKSMVFRAELRLALNDDGWSHSMTPGGGLSVNIWGAPAPRIGGTRLVFNSVFEHEPHLGETDWFQAEVPFEVPTDASRVRVGFVHRANGSFSLREPELLECQMTAAVDPEPAAQETGAP